MANPVATTCARLRLPIQVIGSDLDGRQFFEHTVTVTLYRDGATILLAGKLAPGSEVIVRNLGTNEEAAALVVGQIQKDPHAFVYAISFLDSVDLWRIQFLPTEPGETVLMECSRCHSSSVHLLSEIEVAVFSARRELTRPCAVCETPSIWKESARESVEELAKVAPGADSGGRPGVVAVEERRKNRRLRMQVPACIRCCAREEIVSCEDVSRGGFRFTGRRQYPEGTHIEAAVPYTKSSTNIFCQAHIVFCQRMPDERYRHGVAYPRASRVSELNRIRGRTNKAGQRRAGSRPLGPDCRRDLGMNKRGRFSTG